jgi:hypothetical protein
MIKTLIITTRSNVKVSLKWDAEIIFSYFNDLSVIVSRPIYSAQARRHVITFHFAKNTLTEAHNFSDLSAH